MQYFEESGLDYEALIQKIKHKYGENVRIMNRRRVMMGGFLGFCKKEGWTVFGYVVADSFGPSVPPVQNPAVSRPKHSDVDVMSAIARLEKKMDGQSSLSDRRPESLRRIEQVLEQNDFAPSYIKKILSQLEAEISYENLQNWGYVVKRVREFIKNDIKIFAPAAREGVCRVVILLGPTGVGKTTTVAKLAARSVKAGLRVKIITTDKYKIGADKQIEALAGIMNVPVASVGDFENMSRQMRLWKPESDIIYVDTIGRSPKNPEEINSMRQVILGCGEMTEKYLTVSATTKISDLYEIFRQFEPFGYCSIICTKMDETSHAGNIVSAVYNRNKSLAFITTGQKIPANITEAAPDILLEYMEGLGAV